MTVSRFKKKYPRIWKKITTLYNPIFDKYIAIDMWLAGTPQKTCEICNAKLLVSKHCGVRCHKCKNVKQGITYSDFLLKAPDASSNIYSPYAGLKGYGDLVQVYCPNHGMRNVSIRRILSGNSCGKCVKLQEWKKTCMQVHNGKYDYTNTMFSYLMDIIEICCPVHGIFTQNASIHANGHGCTQCGLNQIRSKVSHTNDEFVTISNKIHDNKYTYKSAYNGSRNKVIIECPIHGDFEQIAYYHLAGNGCPQCGFESVGTISVSKAEYEILDFLKELGVTTQHSYRQLGFEIDIYSPDHKVGIEYNGIYWHSSNDRESDKKKSQQHLAKTDKCNANGIQLLHILDIEWQSIVGKKIWKSVIKAKLGLSSNLIYARKTTIQTLSSSVARDFLNDNHLQGFAQAAEHIGLFHNEQLVSVMSFGRARFRNNDDFEIIRAASLCDTHVVGGFSKLIAAFGKHKTCTLISYANRRWSNGNVYIKTNFSLVNTTSPCYYYWDGGDKIYHRSKFMKNKLEKLLPKFDKNLTEIDNMYLNGFRRIWDCGTLVFERKF